MKQEIIPRFWSIWSSKDSCETYFADCFSVLEVFHVELVPINS